MEQKKTETRSNIMESRKPVSLAIADDNMVIVVCDDGAIFSLPDGEYDKCEWFEMKPIPGSARWGNTRSDPIPDEDGSL
jgi:hypothetical protein